MEEASASQGLRKQIDREKLHVKHGAIVLGPEERVFYCLAAEVSSELNEDLLILHRRVYFGGQGQEPGLFAIHHHFERGGQVTQRWGWAAGPELEPILVSLNCQNGLSERLLRGGQRGLILMI